MPNQYFSPEGDVENYFVSEYWLIDQWVGDTLWVWGRNNAGQLGNNTITLQSTPVTTFPGGTNWKQISCGTFTTAAIKTDGTLWVWGNNGNFQTGSILTGNISTPVTTFAGGTNWKQVSAGGYGVSGIKTDGTLWVWGSGGSGNLGNNVATAGASNRCTPVTTFAGGNNWKQISCGTQYMSAIKTDGTLWTWGLNTNGQLGDNTQISRSTPVTTFAGGTNWKQVSSGLIISPSTGTAATAAIKTDGTLWVWGHNGNGQMGDNTSLNLRLTPVTTFAGGTNWKQVSSGGYLVSAIKTDGTLWTWGYNVDTSLGINRAGNTSTPVTTFAGGTNWKQVSAAVGSQAAIKTDGTLWTWGLNDISQLGTNTTRSRISTPVTTFAGGTNWKQVDAGNVYQMAITSGTDPTLFIS